MVLGSQKDPKSYTTPSVLPMLKDKMGPTRCKFHPLRVWQLVRPKGGTNWLFTLACPTWEMIRGSVCNRVTHRWHHIYKNDWGQISTLSVSLQFVCTIPLSRSFPSSSNFRLGRKVSDEERFCDVLEFSVIRSLAGYSSGTDSRIVRRRRSPFR